MTDERIIFQVKKALLVELFDLLNIDLPDKITDKDLELIISKIKKGDIRPSEETYISPEPRNFKTILVVDDLGLIVYQMSLLLTKAGHSVMLARSTEEAINIVQNNIKYPFDCVVMDLFMPNKEDGIMLLDFINETKLNHKLNTQVIVMSGTKDTEIIEEIKQKGANHFVEKAENWKMDILNLV